MPSARAWFSPPGPNSTSSTAFVSETHIHTTSTPSAASAGEAALRAPSKSLPAERLQTATWCPALTRLADIDRPIIPMPRKATRISFDSSKPISPRLWIRYDQQTDGQGKQACSHWKNYPPKKERVEEIWPLARRWQPPEHLYFARDLGVQSR